jgi:ribulose-phosphate 3-epimerase
MQIYPSLISSDLLDLKQTIQQLDPHCDGYHLDVMDDHFVPNLTWGPAFINTIRQITKLPFHVHLMVDNPGKWLNRLSLQQQDTFIFHHEALPDLAVQKKLAADIHAKGIKAGISINPKTAAERIFDILPYIDLVILMSVEPGFSGQQFIQETTKKINPLLAMRHQLGKNFLITMDGGINHNNIASLAQQNVDIVAVASAIFAQKDPIVALKQLKDIVNGVQ